MALPCRGHTIFSYRPVAEIRKGKLAPDYAILQAVNNQTVDIMLAILLLSGSVIGVQIGTRFGAKLPSEQFRILLAAMVLIVCGKLLFDLVVTPDDLFSLQGHV